MPDLFFAITTFDKKITKKAWAILSPLFSGILEFHEADIAPPSSI